MIRLFIISMLPLLHLKPCPLLAYCSGSGTRCYTHHIALTGRPFTVDNPLIILNKPIGIDAIGNIPHECSLTCTKFKKHNISAVSFDSGGCSDGADTSPRLNNCQQVHKVTEPKSFWGAVTLIIGTAIGPGMLGLPAATIRSGPLPSTVAIIFSWIYVVSSIILVAELSFAAMKEDGVPEVSFTSLAAKALGSRIGSIVALVYASLSFSLLVACVSGIGSIVAQWFPGVNPIFANALFPSIVGTIIWFFPFKVIDSANRFLCTVMMFSIAALVSIGCFVGRANILNSLSYASWELCSMLPAIPVAVLTLGFHVITPFICKIAGNTVEEARKAILVGGVVPLLMVLSWNLMVLGLGGKNTPTSPKDPISLLLSVNASALSAVQGFALSALATSMIGYAVSFPKQVIDTLELIFGDSNSKANDFSQAQIYLLGNEVGKVGFVSFTCGQNLGNPGKISYGGAKSHPTSSSCSTSSESMVLPVVLAVPVAIASFFPSTFSRALDFAGIYANCFLFGILPPVMTYIYQSRKQIRAGILPGGDCSLLLLFSIAVVLAIWH